MGISESVRMGKAAVTYDAAADHFDEAPLAFWDRHGRGAVDRLRLRPGDHVLDVGCGTGASALPAAEAVGPTGHVTGIDIAENMLARAREKARLRGLHNVRFELADMTESGFADQSVDAVISVFSLFFVADMQRQVADLWRLLKPGGQLVVTVWGAEAFEPAVSVFGDGFRRLRPELATSTRPWEILTEPDNLRRLLREGGTTEPLIEPVDDEQPLADPADWWTIAMGSGFRWEIDQLSPTEKTRLRDEVIGRLSSMNVRAIGTSALHAVARK